MDHLNKLDLEPTSLWTWEGIGVCSYLLVNFWYTSITANQNAISAFVTNRIGDACLTMGLMILILVFGGLEYSTVFTQVPYINENVIFIIGLCLILGALAKSAQIGLHIWLPLAMCAPTSVSALLHSATMVTAGVYLLLRSSPLIEYSDTILLICFWLGAVTTIFSSLVGLFQQDIKKIIAYSTISQLGLMMLAVGLSSYNIAIFHLVNHAFYKALLFMGAGSIIHAMQDNQDLRKYGGLLAYLPLTYIIMLIGSLSLMAIPFMTGFYSKDLILESAYGLYQLNGVSVYILATTGAVFTTLYSVRILYLTFLSSPLGSWSAYKNTHEGDFFLTLPLVVLALFSIIFGFLTKDIFVGLGTGFFGDNSLFVNPTHEILLDTEFSISASLKFLPFLLTVGLSVVGLVYQEFWAKHLLDLKLDRLGIITFGFFNQRLLIEMLYNKFIVNSILDFGGHTTKVLDKGSIEWVGPYGLYVILTKISRTVSGLWAGDVQSYALYILLGVCFFLTTLSLIVLSRYLDVMFILFIASVAVLLLN